MSFKNFIQHTGIITIPSNVKNVILGISASGPTKRWSIENYIHLAIKLN